MTISPYQKLNLTNGRLTAQDGSDPSNQVASNTQGSSSSTDPRVEVGREMGISERMAKVYVARALMDIQHRLDVEETAG